MKILVKISLKYLAVYYLKNAMKIKLFKQKFNNYNFLLNNLI